MALTRVHEVKVFEPRFWFQPERAIYDLEPLTDFEEHSDLLSAMLAEAAIDSRRRASAIRSQLHSTLKGPALAAALSAARSQAKADLAGTRAAIRRNFGYARASKRRTNAGSLLVPR